MVPRSRTASGELEGKILAAALELLAEQGSQALTVRGIATRAGVAPMGIYNHFDGKVGVVEAVWTEGFDRLCTAMDVDDTLTPIEALMACGRSYRRFAHEHPAYYRLMFMEHLDDFTPSPEGAVASGRALQILVNRVERAQDAGDIAPGRSIDIAQGIWAAVHGWVSLELLRVNFALDADDAYDRLLQSICRGFRES